MAKHTISTRVTAKQHYLLHCQELCNTSLKQEVLVLCDKPKQVDADKVNSGVSSAVLCVCIKTLRSNVWPSP